VECGARFGRGLLSTWKELEPRPAVATAASEQRAGTDRQVVEMTPMAQGESSSVRPQLSLGGLCRLVGVLAVFFACLLPLQQADSQTLGLALFGEALLTPLALALAVQLFVRRGVLRPWLTWFLLALPLAFLLGTIDFLALRVYIEYLNDDVNDGIMLFTVVS